MTCLLYVCFLLCHCTLVYKRSTFCNKFKLMNDTVNKKRLKKSTDRPKISNFPLEGNIRFFFWPYNGLLRSSTPDHNLLSYYDIKSDPVTLDCGVTHRGIAGSSDHSDQWPSVSDNTTLIGDSHCFVQTNKTVAKIAIAPHRSGIIKLASTVHGS